MTHSSSNQLMYKKPRNTQCTRIQEITPLQWLIKNDSKLFRAQEYLKNIEYFSTN
jgi:hypothetical protein